MVSETTVRGLDRPRLTPSVFGARTRLCLAEQVVLAFFAYVAVAGFVLDLPGRGIAVVTTLNAAAFATLMTLRRNRWRAPWLAAAADLFPTLVILIAYRESGFLLRPDRAHYLDYVFIQWDRALVHSHFVQTALQAGAPWCQHYLEFAYLLCYPLVPLGAAAIRFATRQSAENAAPLSWRRQPTGYRLQSRGFAGASGGTGASAVPGSLAMDDYWSTVLLASLFSYAVYPFFPLTPPRVLFGDVPGPHVEPLLRQWNFWLLDHFSVQACMFPSGHVAATTAVALAVRKHAPRLGALFLFIAGSVAIATVYGRYHYTADALAGALVGVAAFTYSSGKCPPAFPR